MANESWVMGNMLQVQQRKVLIGGKVWERHRQTAKATYGPEVTISAVKDQMRRPRRYGLKN